MTYLFANDAKTTLAASISSAATSLTVASGSGSLFPSPTGGDIFALTLKDAASGATTEIMHCTARSGDLLTVVRGQEGTTALNWAAGDFAGLLVTADIMAAALDGGGTQLAWAVVGGFTDADVAAAVAVINASSNGGVIYFPPGVWTNLPGGYVFTKPVTVIGCGCADSKMAHAVTTIQCSSPTASLFEFDADPWQARNIHLLNTASTTPTAGSAIFSPVGDGHHIDSVTTQGFYNNWQVDNAYSPYWSNSITSGAVNYLAYLRNVALPDGGDQGIVNVSFFADVRDSVSALRWESGGGLRLTNCKFNSSAGGHKFATAIDVQMASGVSTVDLLVSNSSIENFTTSGIKIRGSAGGQINDILVNGVQFGNYGTTSRPIDIDATGGNVNRVMINGAMFIAPSSTVEPISITDVNHVVIGPCLKLNHPKLVSLNSVTDFQNANARLGVEALVDGATISIDLTNAENFRVTLGGNRTLANPTNIADGQVANIRVYQDGTGSRTLAYGSAYKFPGGVAPVLSTAPGAGDLLTFQYDATEGTLFMVSALAFS